MNGSEPLLDIRAAVPGDLPRILALARRALGWSNGRADEVFFRWKHFENPAGTSPMWIALDGERVVGFRTFLRWNLHDQHTRISAVRAVDTATDPEYQRRGVFTSLTLAGVEGLREAGVELIFNTPNSKSLPGYLKMGWSALGRLPVSIRLTQLRSALSLGTARVAADRWSLETTVGQPAAEVLDDPEPIDQLLAALPPQRGLSTELASRYLSWRYGLPSLGYRVVLRTSTPADGLVVFRLRRRGRAREVAVCEVLAPGSSSAIGGELLAKVARDAPADYLIRMGGSIVSDRFVRAPGVGPILACRRLDGTPSPRLRAWQLSLGDVELF